MGYVAFRCRMNSGAENLSPHDTPQSSGARFLVEVVAWVTGPWAAAELTGEWWIAIPVAIVLIGVPAVFSTPGDKKNVLIPTPGKLRVAIELTLLAVAVSASAVVITAWAWYAIVALALAFLITNFPRMRWLAAGATPS